MLQLIRISKMQILLLFFVISFGLINSVVAANIEEKVIGYFNRGGSESVSELWEKYSKPLENALELALKETYGEAGLNVYVRKSQNAYKLTDGLLTSDNVVQVLFKDLYLTQLPRLHSPQVSFSLPKNLLKVEADVGKIFMEADYLLFRNQSSVVYSTKKFDPYQTSPFALQQVKNVGEVTIVAEGCDLTGSAVTTLQGQSLVMAQDDFHLENCKFTVEITSPETGSPPVIAPYFSTDQEWLLEMLLLKPILEEMTPKLQGALFTFVNTSAIFKNHLPKLRFKQNAVLQKTSGFMSQAVSYLSKLISKESGGVAKMDDFEISWTDQYRSSFQDTMVSITNVSVCGLDSIYYAQAGAPTQAPDTEIRDTIRFAAVQVLGNMELDVGNAKNEYVFYGEVQDINVLVTIGIQSGGDADNKTSQPSKSSRKVSKLDVVGWRNMDLHAPDLPNKCSICLDAPKALLTGFLLNNLPAFLEEQISEPFAKAVAQADQNNREIDFTEKNDGNRNEENIEEPEEDGNRAEVNEDEDDYDNDQENTTKDKFPIRDYGGTSKNEDDKDNLPKKDHATNDEASDKGNVPNRDLNAATKNEGTDKDNGPKRDFEAASYNEDSDKDNVPRTRNSKNKSGRTGQKLKKKPSKSRNVDQRRGGEKAFFRVNVPNRAVNVHTFDNEIHSE